MCWLLLLFVQQVLTKTYRETGNYTAQFTMLILGH